MVQKLMEINITMMKNIQDKVALVIGSEGKGLRTRVRETCDSILKIHLKGQINSLNVSVATGILLSQISKWRKKGMKEYIAKEIETKYENGKEKKIRFLK